jgi:hypothetical protein
MIKHSSTNPNYSKNVRRFSKISLFAKYDTLCSSDRKTTNEYFSIEEALLNASKEQMLTFR